MRIPFLKDKNGYTVKVYVKPGSKISGIEGVEEDTLKIKLRAQPHEGAANKELLEILSEILEVPKSKLEIIKGKASRHKIIKIKER